MCAPQVSQTRGARGHSKDEPPVILHISQWPQCCLSIKRAAIIPGVWWSAWRRKRATVWWRHVWQLSLALWWISLSWELHQLWLSLWEAHKDRMGAANPGKILAIMQCFLKWKRVATVGKKNLLHLSGVKMFAPCKSFIASASFTFVSDISTICWAKPCNSVYRSNYWYICHCEDRTSESAIYRQAEFMILNYF